MDSDAYVNGVLNVTGPRLLAEAVNSVAGRPADTKVEEGGTSVNGSLLWLHSLGDASTSPITEVGGAASQEADTTPHLLVVGTVNPSSTLPPDHYSLAVAQHRAYASTAAGADVDGSSSSARAVTALLPE